MTVALGVDVGTTGTKVVAVDDAANVVASATVIAQRPDPSGPRWQRPSVGR